MSDGIVTSGWAMLEAGNAQAAARVAKQALQIDPNNFEALSLLTQAQLDDGDYSGATGSNEQLLRLRPDHLQAHVNRVAIPMRRGLYEVSKQALADFQRARPDAIGEYKYFLALWEYQFGSPSKSIVIWRELIADTPNDMSLHRLLGMAEYEARNPFRAEHAMEQVVQHNANDAKALEILAFTRFRQFAFSDGKALAASSLRLDPTVKPLRWVRWGSVLVLFPPFFVGHGLQWMTAKAAELLGPIAGHFMSLIWVILAVWGVVFAAQVNQTAPFMPAWQGLCVLGAVFAAAWACVVHYILGDDLNMDVYENIKPNVKLDNY